VGVCTIWLRFEPDPDQSGSWILTCIQLCMADSTKSNGRISMKLYE